MKQLNNELHSNCNGRNNCIMYVEVTGPGGAPVYCQVSIKDGFTMYYRNRHSLLIKQFGPILVCTTATSSSSTIPNFIYTIIEGLEV